MNVYIFGAGASQASQGIQIPSNKVRSPLTNELFANDQYRSIAAEVGISHQEFDENRSKFSEFRDKAPDVSLEAWLTQKWSGVDTLRSEQSQYAERNDFGKILIYLWWLFQNVSNFRGLDLYKKFLIQVRRRQENAVFISFNYDTLLDRALSEVFGYPLNNMGDYRGAKLYKLHGSVNWYLQRRNNISPFPIEKVPHISSRIAYACSTVFNGGPVSMGGVQVFPPTHPDINNLQLFHHPVFNSQFFYPLMFLPLTLKSYDQVQGFKEKLIEYAAVEVSKADNIFLIGYKAQDDLIRDILYADSKRFKLHVISKINPEKIYTNLATNHSKISQGDLVKGFDTFIEARNVN